MSVEQAKSFIDRMKTDDAFREKFMAIEGTAGRIVCIQAEGFECTPEEINEVTGVIWGAEVAAGGMGDSHASFAVALNALNKNKKSA